MNFISPLHAQMLADAGPMLTIELAHIWRSRIVDKCAEAERYVLHLLRAGGGDCSPKAPLSQKMESLAKLMAEPGSTVRARKIGPLLERLTPLSELRSELAHSTMSVAEIDDEMVAVLHNAAAADTARTILSGARLRACHRELSQIVNSLRQEVGRNEAGFPLSRE
jgi:hypothetical protein